MDTDRHKGTLGQTTGTGATSSVYSLTDKASAAAASARPCAKNTPVRENASRVRVSGPEISFHRLLGPVMLTLRITAREHRDGEGGERVTTTQLEKELIHDVLSGKMC